MAADNKPVTRRDLQRALAANALTKPLNVALPAAVVVAGIVLGTSWLLPVAALVYAALAATTFFDEQEATRVGEAAYGRDKVLGAGAADSGRLEAKTLAPPIRAQLEAARAEQAAITRTIADSDLSWADVRAEVAALVAALEAAARRAQRLYVYLAAQDAAAISTRIDQLQRAHQDETAGALRTQLAELQRLDEMLHSAYGEMEQVNASLRTVHARLVGAAVSSEAAQEGDIAGDVRELRERVETLTTGLNMPTA